MEKVTVESNEEIVAETQTSEPNDDIESEEKTNTEKNNASDDLVNNTSTEIISASTHTDCGEFGFTCANGYCIMVHLIHFNEFSLHD